MGNVDEGDVFATRRGWSACEMDGELQGSGKSNEEGYGRVDHSRQTRRQGIEVLEDHGSEGETRRETRLFLAVPS